ncbi:MAG: hypothetical protein GXO09_01110 [Crenarchaeota archaeon]|nr:hypothetical protein [Thermoproteota archaeon]
MARYRLPVVVLGVPIRGKRNPYLVMLTRSGFIDVDVVVEESEKPECLIEGSPSPPWSLRIALQEFVGELSARLEAGLFVRVSYSVAGDAPSSSIYAVLSFEVVRRVAEEAGYGLEPGEVVEAAASIDEDAGVGLDYVDGLRRALVEGCSVVYRRGEGAYPADVPGLRLVLLGEETVSGSLEGEIPSSLLSLLTKLSGSVVVEAVSRLRGGEGWGDVWRWCARMENAVYYLVYGLEPGGEGCKWTPGMQSAAMLCLEGRGEGVLLDLV